MAIYLIVCTSTINYYSKKQSTYGSIYDIADIVYGAPFKSSLFNESRLGYPLIRIRDLETFIPHYWTAEAHPKRTFIEPGDVIAGMDADFTPVLWLGEKAVLNQRVVISNLVINQKSHLVICSCLLDHYSVTFKTMQPVQLSHIWEK